MTGWRDPKHVRPLSFPSRLARRGRGEEIREVAAGDERRPPAPGETSCDNPFREDAAKLADLLERLGELYEAEAHGRRDEALREALDEALEGDTRRVGGAPRR